MIVYKMLWKYVSLWAPKKKNSKEISFSLDELLQYVYTSIFLWFTDLTAKL